VARRYFKTVIAGIHRYHADRRVDWTDGDIIDRYKARGASALLR